MDSTFFSRVRESTELENITVTEVVVEEVEEEVMIPEDDDDAWMLDLSDDAVLLSAANDSNGEHQIQDC